MHEVFTRRWVVEVLLNLTGYTVDRDLGSLHLVEPSCGSGAFLGPGRLSSAPDTQRISST
jgi:adenine-specific DNA-methyltransferase